MIRKANELNPAKRFRVLISGVPGIAKSTTALSAPNPLMVDADKGWDRVPAQFRRGAYIQPETYEEILDDLKPENVKDFETIIFDTGGALLTFMKSWAIRKNPKNGQRDGVTLSMVGFGEIGREFSRLIDYCFYTLGKHIVVVFHVKEEMDDDRKVFRLDVEGQTRNNIWKPMDLGGFMEAVGEKRVIGFSPTDRYFAKGTHGISGLLEIPNVMKGEPNDFLTNLFARINTNIGEEAKLGEEYTKLMALVMATISEVKDELTANQALSEIKGMTHIFGSKAESWHHLTEKAVKVGLSFDPILKTFKAVKA